MIRTIMFTILLLPAIVAGAAAQYSSDVFTLKKAQDLYDERGFQQGKAISVDGKLVVSESNGNVSYSYPLASFSEKGYPITVGLNYCGSVAFTSFLDYGVAHDGATDPAAPRASTSYDGWHRFHQNRPAWAIGVNGFAVQMISANSHFLSWPGSRLHNVLYSQYNDADAVWCADGYDFSNRMVDFGAAGVSGHIGDVYIDNIRLMRADGSVLELVRGTHADSTTGHPDTNSSIYTGYYLPMEANTRAFAKVEFDSSLWSSCVHDRLGVDPNRIWPVTPRVARYYPGDGMEYVFRERVAPYGFGPYFGLAATTGAMWGGPTIFYLEEINARGVNLITLDRSRHYARLDGPTNDPYGPNCDSTRGRALFIGARDRPFTINYGPSGMTVQAFGRTTTVMYTAVMPSGTASMGDLPIAAFGYNGAYAGVYASIPDSEAVLYRSALGYVTKIIDPEGRVTNFTYEQYGRNYLNFGFPRAGGGGGGDVGIMLKNYRLKSVTEPTARYTIDYFKKPSDLSYVEANESLYVTTTGDTQTVKQGFASEHDAALLSNVAAVVRKYELDNTLLTTDRYWFTYATNSTFAETAVHAIIDNVNGTADTTETSFRRYALPALAPRMPAPVFTAPYNTVHYAAGTTTATTTLFGSAPGSSSVMSAWGLTYNGSASVAGTPYVVLDTAHRTWVNGILKSYVTTQYTLQGVRSYGGDSTLTAYFGVDVVTATEAVHNPATSGVITSTIKDFLHLPYVERSGVLIYPVRDKFATYAKWDSLRRADTAFASIPKQISYYDPRVQVYLPDPDSVAWTRHVSHMVLPAYTRVYDASFNLLGGTVSTYWTTYDAGDSLSYTHYGAKTADSVIGTGGAARFRSARYETDHDLPLMAENANGAVVRSLYEPANGYLFPGETALPSGGTTTLTAAKLDNRDSVRAVALFGGAYGNFTKEPLAVRRDVRRHDPSTLALDTAHLAEYTERDYYGLPVKARDANGWLTRALHDRNGRLRYLWLPGDFQNPDSIYTREEAGWDSTDGYGMSQYTFTRAWEDCGDGPPDDSTFTVQTITSSLLYADDPTNVIPSCPPCGSTEEKGSDRSPMALCTSPIVYYLRGGTIGSATFRALPPKTTAVLSLDSAFVRLFVTSVTGSCPTLKVAVPRFGLVKYFQFNSGGCYIGGGDTVAGGSELLVDLTPYRTDLLTMGPDSVIVLKLEMTTPDARVECTAGADAEDLAPRLMLKGTFRKVNELADYTLAYFYDDTLLTARATARVDDSIHTANRPDIDPLVDIARRATVKHTFGADGRRLKSTMHVVEDNAAARWDSTTAAYTGLGKAVRAIDQEGDTIRTTYDALGRPVTATNADGTVVTTAYAFGSAASFGITDQDFYGFAARTVRSDENGALFASYTDAFDRLRREVADTAGLKFITRYEYDSLNRLTRVVNPKGDTTRYWYDLFGRVRYKSQPDLGAISYAYDKVGNVRYVQTEEQWYKSKLGFNQYDDLNRLVIVGEAIIGESAHRTTIEDEGWDDENSWLHGHARSAEGIYGTAEGKKAARQTMAISGPRITDSLDAAKLAIGAKWDSTMTVTANETVWQTPGTPTPTFWAPAQSAKQSGCTLPTNAMLMETQTPKGPYLRHPVGNYASPATPYASLTDFEDAAIYPHFVRIAISYDTLPARVGSIWSAFPTYTQWDALMPKGKVRNMKGHEAVVAYREHGGEPYHYAVMSYDERGRVEALVRYTENLGFDAVYYAYNSMNLVTSVRVMDFNRTHQTWYGYDAQGRMDSVWTSISSINAGLVPGPFTGSTWTYRTGLPRPDAAEIVYRYTRAGQVDTMAYPRINVLVDYAYNHRKWLDSMVAKQSGGALWKEALTYDPSGQITGQGSKHGTSPSTSYTYSYDPTQRLTLWTMPGLTERYGYDAAGNRTSAQSVTPLQGDNTAYAYGGAAGGSNRLASATVTDTTGAITRRTATYAYDRNGATVMKRTVDANPALSYRQEYAYSYRGLARRYGSGNLTTMQQDWRYRYSAAGEREQKRLYWQSANDTVTPYPWVYYLLGGHGEQLAVYHGQQIAGGTWCSDTGRRVYMYPVEYWTYGFSGTGSVMTAPNLTKKYVVADHLGSARVTLDSGGTVTERLEYQPFGEATAIAGAVTGVRKNYIDKERDVESGTLNLGVRQMEGGRFLSVEPMWEKYPGMSPYAYAANNPLRLMDPNGQEFTFYKADAIIDDDGRTHWVLQKDENGNPIVDTKLQEEFECAIDGMAIAGVPQVAMLKYLGDSKDYAINVVRVELPSRSAFAEEETAGGPQYTLTWAPGRATMYLPFAGASQDEVQSLSPAVSLIHEGSHPFRRFLNVAKFRLDMTPGSDPQYDNIEERNAINDEFVAGQKLNQLKYIRPAHKARGVIVRYPPVCNPMQNTYCEDQ